MRPESPHHRLDTLSKEYCVRNWPIQAAKKLKKTIVKCSQKLKQITLIVEFYV